LRKDDDDATDDAFCLEHPIQHAPAELARYSGSMLLGTSLLCRQMEFAGNMIAISVECIGGLEFEINHQGSLVSLVDLVKKLKSGEGTALISGIEPTKFTSDSGCYLFLMQKNVVNEAGKKLNNLFETLAKDGQLDTFCIEGMFICRLNQIQLKTVAIHAESLHLRLLHW
jgi:hypothetical protein